MKTSRLRKLRRRWHKRHGHLWRSWQTITRAARRARWSAELMEGFEPDTH